jgi:hypothetical protein
MNLRANFVVMSPSRNLVLASFIVILLFGILPRAGAQSVTVNSGGAVRFLDSGSSATDFTTAFTAANFTAAQAGPTASVLTSTPFYVSSLPHGPGAVWIGTNASAGASVGDTALYAASFTLPSNVSSASLTLYYDVDNNLGYANPGIYINGTALPASTGLPPGCLDQVCAFTQENTYTDPSVGSLLVSGTNWIYLDAVNLGGPAGLIFSAVINYTVGPACAPAVVPQAAAAAQNVISCDANFTPSTLSSELSGPSGLVYRHPTNDLVVAQNASSVVSTVILSSGNASPFTGAPPSSPFDVAIRPSDGLVAVLNEALGQITFYNSAGSQLGSVSISTVSPAYSCGAGLAFDTLGNLYVGAGPANAVIGLAAASASPGNCQATGWSVLEFAGQNQQSPWLDTSVTTVASLLNEIGGLAFTAAPLPNGALYAVSSSGGNVYQIPLGGEATTIAATITATTIAMVASALDPRGIAADPLTGDLFISQFNGTTVYRIPAGTTMVTTFATGFNNTSGLAFDTTGNLYVCDYNAGIIYKFSRASNATPMVPLTSGSPNTFTFTNPNPAMSDQYQSITIPASANLNGAASLQEIFVSVSPTTLNATLSKGSPGDLARFGGSPVPPGTICWPSPSANNNCVVTIQVCYDVNGNPFAICPVQVPSGNSDLILLSSHWNGTLPTNPGLVIDYDSDPSGQLATSIGSSSSSDPTMTGGSKGLCSKTYPVNLGASIGPDFSISVSPRTIPLLLDGSNSATVTVNSINGFSSPVNLTVSTAPVGVTATTSSPSVTPPSNGPITTNLNVSLAPYVTPTPVPIPLFVSATDAAMVTHPANVSVTVTATHAGIQKVIQAFLNNGCMLSGMSGAMDSELSASQVSIAGGDYQTGVNTLGAFDDQDEDDGGRHISRSCTIGGYTFNPVQVLHIDVRSLIDSYKTQYAASPITGYVLNSSNVGVAGAVVSIYNSSGQRVAGRVTDITGFFFFGKTSMLQSKATYTVKVAFIPEGYSVSIPLTQSFTWSNAAVPLPNFLLK